MTPVPLRADEELLPVIARIVFPQPPQPRDHRAIGQHDFQPQRQLPRHAVPHDVDAARIGGQHAAELRRALRGQAHRQQQPGRGRCLLRGFEDAARLRLQREPDGIDLPYRVHPAEREHEFRLRPRSRRDARHRTGREARVAALRHDRDAGLGGRPHHGSDLGSIRGTRDGDSLAAILAAPVHHIGRDIVRLHQDMTRAEDVRQRRQQDSAVRTDHGGLPLACAQALASFAVAIKPRRIPLRPFATITPCSACVLAGLARRPASCLKDRAGNSS